MRELVEQGLPQFLRYCPRRGEGPLQLVGIADPRQALLAVSNSIQAALYASIIYALLGVR